MPSDTSFVTRVRNQFTNFLSKTELVTDEIVKVTLKMVVARKQSFTFDFLVIATGIDYPILLKNKDSVFTPKSSQDAIQIARYLDDVDSLLVIGMGLTGVELAA
ncbi:MAG: FAD-dependent oxidoreductase [Promethearchaeota archaeon]